MLRKLASFDEIDSFREKNPHIDPLDTFADSLAFYAGVPEREVLTHQRNKFDYSLGSNAREFAIAVKHLVDVVKRSKISGNAQAKKLHRPMEMLLANLLVAHVADPYRLLAYSRDNNSYSARRYTAEWMTRDPFFHCIDGLHEARYVEHIDGFVDNLDHCRQSRVTSSPALIRVMEQWFGVDVSMVCRKGALPETIILKSPKKAGKKKKVDYEDDDCTNAMRLFVATYNQFIDDSDITLMAPGKRLTETANYHIHRIFNNSSFEQGGRFYGPWWQGDSELRKHIRINGNPTIELDYAGTHPHLLYSMDGLRYADVFDTEDDPYHLPSHNVSRPVVKEIFQRCLNGESQKAAAWKIKRKNDFPAGTPKFDIGAVIAAMLEKHKLIAHHFFNDIGVRLQYQDSLICERIMRQCMKDNICVLTVHDSFIVEAQHEAYLRELMIWAWKASGFISIPAIKLH